MRSASSNQVKYYSLNGVQSRDATRNIQLIQDFEFPSVSYRIKITRDSKYAIASGAYKPHIRVYEFAQASLKFERHQESENVDLVCLADDWTKFATLQSDRSIEFHAKSGLYYKTRIPCHGRAVRYNPGNCELVVAAASDELYRLNIERGTFMNPFKLLSDNANSVEVSDIHGLTAVGTDAGIELWDPRIRTRLGSIFTGGVDGSLDSEGGVSCLSFADDGLHLAAGTMSGYSLIYDLRSPQPILRRDQGYGSPLNTISFLKLAENSESNRIMSADANVIKIWDVQSGSPYMSIKNPTDIREVVHCNETGLFLVANEGPPMHIYYVPDLGPAPKWCSFLENVTEELDVSQSTPQAYDSYRFVTKQELRQLGLEHLAGTDVVKDYMHGFFIDTRLWEKARVIMNPNIFEEHRKKTIDQKIEKDRESRIRSSIPKKVKVNKVLADRLARQEEKRMKRQGQELQENEQASVFKDDRFKAVFSDPDFAVEEDSVEYTQLSARPAYQKTMAELSDEERTFGGPETSSSESEDDISDGSDTELNSSTPKKNVKVPKSVRFNQNDIPSTHDSKKSVLKNKKTFADLIAVQNQSKHNLISRNGDNNGVKVTNEGLEMTFTLPSKHRKQQNNHFRDTGRSKMRTGGRRASGNALRKR